MLAPSFKLKGSRHEDGSRILGSVCGCRQILNDHGKSHRPAPVREIWRAFVHGTNTDSDAYLGLSTTRRIMAWGMVSTNRCIPGSRQIFCGEGRLKVVRMFAEHHLSRLFDCFIHPLIRDLSAKRQPKRTFLLCAYIASVGNAKVCTSSFLFSDVIIFCTPA